MPTKSRTISASTDGPADPVQEQIDALRAELADLRAQLDTVRSHCGHQPVGD